jgi:ubiquinol-cytochrome c reductase cytochrome c1 subunit
MVRSPLSLNTSLAAMAVVLMAMPVAAYATSEGHTPTAPTEGAAAPEGAASEPSAATSEAADANTPAAETAQGHEEHATAPEGEYEMDHLHWSFDGIFGAYDRASLQRGFQVYKEVCSACHSMTRLSYRNLSALGYSDAEVKAIAASVTINDGPNDEGEMFDRPGKPSDHFKSPFPNVQAAKAGNGGAYPPDMSLLAKARHGGADYIHAILTGYTEPPAGKELMAGQYWNRAMHGNIIAMPEPLTDGRVAYSDGSPQTVEQYSRDVAQFLTWASEPHMEERKRMGIKAFLFMLVFAGVLFGVKRKIWADQH